MSKEINLDEGTKEFFDLLKLRLDKIMKNYKDLEKKIELYNNCCNYDDKKNICLFHHEKMEKLLSAEKGRKKFTELLKEVFEKDFFNYSENKSPELNNKNISIKGMFDLIFNKIVGFYNGKLIEIPKDYDDFIIQIRNIIDLVNSNLITESEISNLSQALFTIENHIANKYANLWNLALSSKITIIKLEEILRLYNSNKIIEIEGEKELIFLLNNNFEYEITHENEKITNKDIGFGDLLKSFIDDYNEFQKVKSSKMLLDNLLKKLKGKNASEAESKIDSVSKNMIKKFTQNKLDEQSLIIFEYLLDKEADNSWNQDSYEYYKAINELAMDCTSYMHKNKIYSDSALASKIVGNFNF